jgi:hypothetical protein
MRRPVGITILCVALAWLTLAGIGNAYLLLTGQFGLPRYHGVLAAAYAISTLFACVGLWKMRVWGLYWLRTWMLVCVGMVVAMIPAFGVLEGGFEGILMLVVFCAVVLALFWFLNRYVGGHVRRVA